MTMNNPDTTTEATAVMDTAAVRDRQAERAERDRALGIIPKTDEPLGFATTAKVKRTTDRWHGSLALTVLRIVTAAIIGIRGWQHLTDLDATNAMFANSILPQSNYWGWGLGIAEALTAILLLLGLANRFAGLLVMIVEIGMLVFFLWGKANPFQSGRMGFTGELEVLLAAVGMLFLLLGSGGWGFDAMFRNKREERKAAKSAGDYL